MGKFIYSSENYANLLTSFSLISEYIKKDFVNLLLIITENYDKINEICLKSNSALNINEFVVQKPNDDVNKIQNYLDIIVKKKLENKFKCININLNMWDFYLSNNNNSNFLEYFKSYLIIGSLSYNEIIESLLFITRYTNKDFVELLKIMVDNYDKLKSICMTENKQIIINDFIVQNVNDNQEKIKEYYTQIASRKIKDSYETIFFDINIWKFYILNHCPFEFLSYIEKKIYESSLFSRDIFDCLSFSADLRNKSFIPMLEIILNHLDKIQNIFKNEMKNIFIDSYIIQQKTDDLSKIYELIKEIIEKEKNNMYCSIKFSVNLWLPYSQTDKLDILKYIRKIINVCRIMEPELNEDTIQLAKKIHDVGFIEIQKGILVGEKLLQFLGEDEAFYVNKQINDCIQANINLQNQISSQAFEIQDLKVAKNNLTNRVGNLEKQVNNLSEENIKLKGIINHLESEKNRIDNKIDGVKNSCQQLEKKVVNIENKQKQNP